MPPLDIESSASTLQLPTVMMKDESHPSHQVPITMMNTYSTSGEENGSGSCHEFDENDDTSHPGTLVVNEDVDHDDIDTFWCWRYCCCYCCGDSTSSSSSSPRSSSLRSKKESMIFWCLAVVTVLIVAAGTLTAVMLRMSTKDHTSQLPQPISSPSNHIPRTELYYQERYEIFFQSLQHAFDSDGSTSSGTTLSTLLTTPDTPQYQAFHWMVYDDTTIVSHPTDKTNTDSTVVAEQSSTPLIQRYIIMVLYYTCGGEAWQMDSTSSSITPSVTGNIAGMGHIETCDWGSALDDPNFIVCSDATTTKEIVALQLDQKRLIGQLPHELFMLSSLVTLDVSYNFLKGTIPSNLFNQMVQLQTLRLNNNEFVGPLPSSVGRLASLREMILGYNYFTGSIPKEYESLTQLQHFHVKDIPSLQGPFFTDFGKNWKNLQYLILDGTALTGTIPSNVISSWSDSIVDIQMGGSLFSGTFPTELGTCTQLTNLYSIGMNMYGPFPNITTLTNLKYLTIQGTDITGTIPTEIGTLSELNELSIRFTSVSGTIPTEIGSCTNLELFTITNTNITGTIPEELTNNVPTLSLITLQDNTGLEGTSIPDTLCPYIESGLLHLSISCNIECTCCIDQCTTSSSTGGIV